MRGISVIICNSCNYERNLIFVSNVLKMSCKLRVIYVYKHAYNKHIIYTMNILLKMSINLNQEISIYQYISQIARYERHYLTYTWKIIELNSSHFFQNYFKVRTVKNNKLH